MSKVAIIGIVGNSVFLPVERFHVGGETVEASAVHFEPGGKGFNAAVAAARYGAEVSYLAAVGTDGYADIKAFLENEKIAATLVQKPEGTAFAAIVTDKSGSNHVTVYQGAQLTADDVMQFESKIAEADVLLLNNEVTEAVNIRAVELAKRYGVRVVLNPAPARALHPYFVENVDLFTPNEHERESIDMLPNLVVTLGKRGCLIKALNQTIPAVDVAAVVDTTGAGDTFNGVLAAMLAEGAELPAAVERANLASSIGVTRKYAVSSIPTKQDILSYLNKKE